MTLEIVLTSEQEMRLKKEADDKGLTPEEYARELLERSLSPTDSNGNQNSEEAPLWQTATSEELIQAMDKLAEKNKDLPILSPEAFDREIIYADEERAL